MWETPQYNERFFSTWLHMNLNHFDNDTPNQYHWDEFDCLYGSLDAPEMIPIGCVMSHDKLGFVEIPMTRR